MNKRYTLSAVLTLIGALGFGFVSFLGSMYLNQGDYLQSLIKPTAFTLALLLSALIAAHFKKARFNFQKNAVKEVVFIGIYILLAIMSMANFTHFFNIQERKEEVGGILKNDINKIRKMFSDYEIRVNERVNGFDGYLDAIINSKNTNRSKYLNFFTIGGPSDEIQKNNKLNMYQDDLKPVEYDSIKKNALKWLDESEVIVTGLRPIGLMDVIGGNEKNANGWYAKIQSYDRTRNTFKDELIETNFEFELSFNNINDELTKVEKPMILSLLYLLGLHILILFVYILAIRDGRSDGLFKSLLITDRVYEDEKNKI